MPANFLRTRSTSRVLIAANRLPITAREENGVVQFRPSDGGLAAGLRHVARRWPVRWFGWNGLPHERTSALPAPLGLRQATLVDVPMSANEVERFYRRFCNELLWPMLHSWTPQYQPRPLDWGTYCAVNARYAEAMFQQLQVGDCVWVHDYHLFLLPGYLRQRAPDAPIAFFLHTPFPAASEFAAIPHFEQLIDGMLGADVLGFHTAEYANNFIEAACELGYLASGSGMRVGDRLVEVKTRPMGIDVGSFSGLASDPAVRARVAERRSGKGALLLGVDRLDYTKGILQRLLAFECLLERHPELRGRTTLTQIAVPTREDVAAYRDLRQMVEAIVARVNRNYSDANWRPIEYVYGTVDLETLVSLYCAADVMLVTSQRDGLNLVAKEFIAARTDEDGVLILSRFAGAAEELAGAIQVNPNRISELADSYYAAMVMTPSERRFRMRQLRRAVESNDVFRWAAEFVDLAMHPAEQAIGS